MPRGVQCIACQHVNLRGRPSDEKEWLAEVRGMAKIGYGRCGLDGLTRRFLSITGQRECGTYAAAPDEVAQARRDWLAQQGKA